TTGGGSMAPRPILQLGQRLVVCSVIFSFNPLPKAQKPNRRPGWRPSRRRGETLSQPNRETERGTPVETNAHQAITAPLPKTLSRFSRTPLLSPALLPTPTCDRPSSLPPSGCTHRKRNRAYPSAWITPGAPHGSPTAWGGLLCTTRPAPCLPHQSPATTRR